jgi:hypothetical protein
LVAYCFLYPILNNGNLKPKWRSSVGLDVF